jgi:hypothetical protein
MFYVPSIGIYTHEYAGTNFHKQNSAFRVAPTIKIQRG